MLSKKRSFGYAIKSKKNLPDGYTFKIWDAYRPFELQKELYFKYKDQIIETFKLEKLSKEKQEEIIKNYISLPIEDENEPPLHTTGGAIDLTVVDLKTGKDLDMGIGFDEFSNLTNTDAYEKNGMNKIIRNNRRILYNSMIKAGFINLPSEVWHYDYGDKYWAFHTGKSAIYKGIFKLK